MSAEVDFAKAEDIMKQISNCTICRANFISPFSLPRSTTCTHYFCSSCIDYLLKCNNSEDFIMCPTCREFTPVTATGVNNSPVIYRAIGVAQELDKKRGMATFAVYRYWDTCGTCGIQVIRDNNEFNPANQAGGGHVLMPGNQSAESNVDDKEKCHFCYECNLVFCSDCSSNHCNMKGSADHKVKAYSNRTEMGRVMPYICSTHGDSQIRFYCHKCHEFGCLRCLTTDHIGHAFSNLSEASALAKHVIDSLLEKLKEKRKILRDTVTKVKEKYKEDMANIEKENEKWGVWMRRKMGLNKEKEDEEIEVKRRRLEELNTVTSKSGKMEAEYHKVLEFKAKYATFKLLSYGEQIINTGLLLTEAEKLLELFEDLEDDCSSLSDDEEGDSDVNNQIQELNPDVPEPPLEKCLCLLVQYSKCRFLWKLQLYSIDHPGHMKILNFAQTLSLRSTVCFIHNDSIYSIGGSRDAHHLWEFSQFNNRWFRRANLPLRRRSTCVIAYQEKMYIFGGNPMTYANPQTNLQIYDLKTNLWSTFPTALTRGTSDAAILEHDGLIYIFGGRVHYRRREKHVQVFDPRTNISHEIQQMPTKHRMHALRWKHYGILIGRISACLFDFNTKTWRNRKAFCTHMYHFSMTIVDDVIQLVGGRQHGTDCWKFVDMMTLPVVAFINNKDVKWKVHYTHVPNQRRKSQKYSTAFSDNIIHYQFT